MADVMVVDDDDDIRELIAMRVRRLGHRVTSVGDPGAALAHASTADVDLALLDWSMPAMNGGELCARLRELAHLADTPILMVTAHADPETRAGAFAAGATGYLTKPFALRELDAHVQSLLETGSCAPLGSGTDVERSA